MKLTELEKLLNSEDKNDLEKVIDELKEDLEKVEYYANTVFKGNLTRNPAEAKDALSYLTGIYMNLNTISELASFKAESIETKSRNKYRIKVNKEKPKYTTTDNEQSKITSRADALIYKRISVILNSYKEDCKTAIGSLQSILKSEKREYNSND